MRRRAVADIAAVSVVCLAAIATEHAITAYVGRQPDGSYIIPSGQRLTPAGHHIEVSDRPLGMRLSPDVSLMVVSTGSNFASRAIHVIDVPRQTVIQIIPVKDSFVGIAFSSDGRKLFIGGGSADNIRIFARDRGGRFQDDGAISIPQSAPSGIAVSPDDSTLYVALNRRHTVAIVDLRTRSVKQVPVGSYPYTTAITADGSKVYITNWGGRRPRKDDLADYYAPVVVAPDTGIPNSGTISVLDTSSQNIVNEIEVGLHPSAMTFSPS